MGRWTSPSGRPHRAVVGVVCLTLLLAACGGPPPEPSGPDTPPVPSGPDTRGGSVELPPFDANCPSIAAAVDVYGEEQVFRAQVQDGLSQAGDSPEDAGKKLAASAVFLMRDPWSICGRTIPKYAQRIVDKNPQLKPPPSKSAQAIRETFRSLGIQFLNQATDGAIDAVGKATCSMAEPMQPLTTSDIALLTARLAKDYDADRTLLATAFLLIVTEYCPDLDIT